MTQTCTQKEEEDLATQLDDTKDEKSTPDTQKDDDTMDVKSTPNSQEKEDDTMDKKKEKGDDTNDKKSLPISMTVGNLKMNTNDNNVDSETSGAKQAHYSIFCILFMLGFLMHCRKYPKETYSSITMAHIVAFISVPRETTTLYQDVTFLSFCSFCLFTMLQDSPYNANHHNM
jgi:hypothetical protein